MTTLQVKFETPLKILYLIAKHLKHGICKQGPNKWGEMGEGRR